MKLGDYVKALEGLIVTDSVADGGTEVRHIAYDSQKTQVQTLFICKGAGFQEKYLQDAQKKGAICYIAEKKFNEDSDYIIVSDLRLALGKVVSLFFGRHEIPLFGITGTKGKTTTAMLLRSVLDTHYKAVGQNPSALLCSVLTFDGEEEQPSRLTTKEPIELNQHIAKAQRSKTPCITMEVSSQAVKYHRIYGLEFEMGCYLNIGEDHISPQEHPDFEDYFTSKLAFFAQCKHLSIHLDGVLTQRVMAAVPEGCTVSTCSRQDERADFYVISTEKRGISTAFTLKTPRGEEEYVLQMAGMFNLDNAISAISMAHYWQIPYEHIAQGIMMGRTTGRMEFYSSQDEKLHILVDYAHNKMSFQALFASMKEEFPDKKLVAVFGCPGEKALDRREDMGKIADSFADFSFLTEDDPGHEPVHDICQEIAYHMTEGKYRIQTDRTIAVEEACNLFMGEEKVVLLLGKGAESDQKRGNLYVQNPSDAQLAMAFIEAYNQLSL